MDRLRGIVPIPLSEYRLISRRLCSYQCSSNGYKCVHEPLVRSVNTRIEPELA